MAESKPTATSDNPRPGALGRGGLRRRVLNVPLYADAAPRGPLWTYPGAGTAKDVDAPVEALAGIRAQLQDKPHQLGEWPSTAISGNDIMSSVLYSSGLVAVKAGKLAPIPLILVSALLYFFRFIYEEVVTAIPLNGGSYNVLLNTTSKRVAAFGAALGILSYLATGVVSGTSAVNYLKLEADLPLVGSTIGLLFLFAVLNLIGITESSRVALGIFLHHILVLTVLSVACIIHVVQHPHVFRENMKTDLPRVDFAGDTIDSNFFAAIFFGFSAAMLGITGFESSAQFVEEQKPGVFRKTLRNMWGLSAVYNIILIFMALGVLPVEKIINEKDTVLAEMGKVAAGGWLKTWIAVDAFIVLSGAVLTSYVGITGLVRRLACDRVLPAFLMNQNKWRKTNHHIIILYFLVASSLVLILKGDNSIMGGVYTYAFLGLMALFSFGCMVLKTKRAEIPRDIRAPWWTCIMGFSLVVVGIFGNLLGDPKVLMYFALYLIFVVAVMMIMMDRVTILRILLAVMKKLFPSRSAKPDRSSALQSPAPVGDGNGYASVDTPEEWDSTGVTAERTGARGGRTITNAIIGINEAPIIFFCKHPDMTIINKAILYVRKNEQTHNLRIVHISNEAVDGGEDGETATVRNDFETIVALFDHIYPKLKIDFVSVHGEFEPALVKWLSETSKVPINMMFIAQPGDKEAHKVSTSGVRVITA